MSIPLMIYYTREAGFKFAGHGAVLDGILGAQAYRQQVARTLVVGPLFASERAEMEQLDHARNRLTIFYSSLHDTTTGVTEAQQVALAQIEQTFQVTLVYGKRPFGAHEHEVLLVDAMQTDVEQLRRFKQRVSDHYDLNLARYEWSTELTSILATAQPLFAACKALGIDTGLAPEEKWIVAMGWLGLPFVFAMQLTEPKAWRSIFYADECATARHLIDDHDGHDTRFYNTLSQAHAAGIDMEELFGAREDLFKHALIKQAVHCDHIFAVGDFVIDEMRFLGGTLRHSPMELTYCGVPAHVVTKAEKRAAKALLQQYCYNLLGYIPDYVFTHVARMVPSKALWRDILVMQQLEHLLRKARKTAVFYLVSSSSPAGRLPEQVLQWEQEYGWPVIHRTDNGDLFADETPLYEERIRSLNSWARQSKAILVNQFGWSRDRCGQRMPAAMSFRDLRIGADVEFGQSTYEPFGIAHLEPLGAGTLCCVSSICGCARFAQRVTATLSLDASNLVVADYVTLPAGSWLKSAHSAIALDKPLREWVERETSAQIAQTIFDRLPKTEQQVEQLLAQGQAIAQQMSWEVVVREQFLPALHHMTK